MVRIITQESQEGLTIVGQKGLQGVDDQCRRMLHVGSLAQLLLVLCKETVFFDRMMRDETVMMRAFLVSFQSFFWGSPKVAFVVCWLQMCAEFMAGMIRRSAVVYRAADLLSLCMSRNAEGIKGLMVCVIDLCF